jgi:hypothetical protein
VEGAGCGGYKLTTFIALYLLNPIQSPVETLAIVARINSGYREMWRFSSSERPRILFREQVDPEEPLIRASTLMARHQSKKTFAVFDASLGGNTGYFRARLFSYGGQLISQKWAVFHRSEKVVAGFDRSGSFFFEGKSIDQYWARWDYEEGTAVRINASKLLGIPALESGDEASTLAYLVDLLNNDGRRKVLSDEGKHVADLRPASIEFVQSKSKVDAPKAGPFESFVWCGDFWGYAVCDEGLLGPPYASSGGGPRRRGIYLVDGNSKHAIRICDGDSISALSTSAKPLLVE